jgi:hypothetical protein
MIVYGVLAARFERNVRRPADPADEATIFRAPLIMTVERG